MSQPSIPASRRRISAHRGNSFMMLEPWVSTPTNSSVPRPAAAPPPPGPREKSVMTSGHTAPAARRSSFAGEAPPLRRQPLRSGRQPHRQSRQRLLHLPVADPKLAGDPGDAQVGVAAGLQVGAQALEPKHSSALLQVPIAAAIDRKPARKEQPTRRLCWLWVCPCVAGGAGDGDGDPGGDHRLQQPGGGGVERAPLDQVGELQAAPREGADGHHRAVGGERGEDGVEALAAGEPGVDPGSGLVDPQAEGGDDPLDQGGHGGGGGEPDRGALDRAVALDPDVGGAVDEHVGDGGVGQQRAERAEAGELVADRPDGGREARRREQDALVAEGVGDRGPEPAGAGAQAGGGQAVLDPFDQPGGHAGWLRRAGPARGRLAGPDGAAAVAVLAGGWGEPAAASGRGELAAPGGDRTGGRAGHAGTAANGTTRLARVSIAWTAGRSWRSRSRAPSSAAAASSGAAAGMSPQSRSPRMARTSRGASGAWGRTPVTTPPAASGSRPAAAQVARAAWSPRIPAVSQRPTASSASAWARAAWTAGPSVAGRSQTTSR